MSLQDYPKSYLANGYPVHVSQPNASLKRVEPLLTPAKFRSRFLKGLQPLFDKLNISFTNEELKDFINRAVNQVELELNVSVVAQEYTEKVPWDASLFKSWIWTQVTHPISRLDSFAIVSANGEAIFNYPAAWIDAGKFSSRIITVIPLLAIQSTGGVIASQPNGVGWALLHARMGVNWIPAYFQCTYKSGLGIDANSIPVIVNELIGSIAASLLLSGIAPVNNTNSVSLGQDGISQSQSGPGVQIFVQRLQELEAQKQSILKQLKRVYSMKIFMSEI